MRLRRVLNKFTDWRYEVLKFRENMLMWIAWILPRRLVLWCAIRVMANATTGRWSHQVVPELMAMDALNRWTDDKVEIDNHPTADLPQDSDVLTPPPGPPKAFYVDVGNLPPTEALAFSERVRGRLRHA